MYTHISGHGRYIDPKTKQVRTIPLELFYKQDAQPVYGVISDDDGRATETMILPFQAYGALGMARDNGEPDSGSSQFFFLKVGVYVYISLVVAAYHTIPHY